MYSKDKQGVIYDNFADYCCVIGVDKNASADIVIPSRIDGRPVYYIINESFLNNKKIKSIKISEGIKYIGSYAFSGCSSLVEVSIPQGVSDISINAFDKCDSLKDVFFVGDRKSWDKMLISKNPRVTEKLRFISEPPQNIGGEPVVQKNKEPEVCREREPGPLMMKQFSGYIVVGPGDCAEGDVVIPSIYSGVNVVEIANEAFKNCRKLKSVVIPPSVVRVGFDAFAGCTSLESVTIPKSVSKLDPHAFRQCGALREINYQGSKFDWNKLKMDASFSRKYASKVKFLGGAQISITESLHPDPDNAQPKPESVQTSPVNVQSEPENVHSTPIVARPTTENIRCATGSAGLAYEKRGDGYVVTGIGSCKDADLVIPETHDGLSVVSVAEKAFYVLQKGFPQMKSVRFPDTLTSIGEGAFWGCTSLTEITVPSGVTVIEQSAFRRCRSLVKIHLHESVKTIGPQAFSECGKLEEISIPESVTEIGHNAFSMCVSLKNISIPRNVTRIDDYVFSGCVALKFVRIPHWVTSIGAGAFYGCASMTTVILPRALEKLNGKAFTKCAALKYICAACSEDEWENVEIDDPDGCFDESLLYFEGDVSYPNGKHWAEDSLGRLRFSFDSY